MKIIKRIIARIKHERFCKLNNYFCPNCIYHELKFEGAIFRGNDCRYPR